MQQYILSYRLLRHYQAQLTHQNGRNDVELFRPEIINLEHWFCENTINELGKMKVYIDNIMDIDEFKEVTAQCLKKEDKS